VQPIATKLEVNWTAKTSKSNLH